MIEKIDIDTLIQEATTLHQQAKFSEAQTIYQHILTIEPDHFDALRLLGLLFAQIKKYTQAVETLTKALKVNPNHARSCSNLGIALKGLEQFDEALASFDKALSLNPDFADAYINRGNVLQNLKRFDEALASFDKALSIEPDYAETHFNRANILQNLKRFDEALASFDKVLSLKPDYAEAYYNRGNILLELNRLDEALASFDKAIKFKPDYVEAYYNRGNTLLALKRFDEALASYDQTIKMKPDNEKALCNRGLALKNLNRYEEALASYEEALALKPNYLEVFNNQSSILDELKRFDEAIYCYKRVIQIEPNLVLPHYNLSITNLRLGNFKEGWEEYEWRWKLYDKMILKTSRPSWDYKKTNKKLLIWCEQGVGDHIAFGTILADLLKVIPNLSVQIDKRLITIFSRSLPKIKFYPKNLKVPESAYEIHAPIAGLGGYLRNTEEDFISSRDGYLRDDEIKTTAIKKDLLKLSPTNNKICGVSWHSSSKKGGSQRSIPLKYLIKMLDLKGYTFVSLQYGDTTNEIKEVKDELGIDVISYDKVDNFTDIDGLASLIQACDTVVSVDNITCHIAGALGKEAYLLLSNERWWWGWMTKRNNSPWYSSIKLYRQEKIDDWSGVFKRLKVDLKMSNK